MNWKIFYSEPRRGSSTTRITKRRGDSSAENPDEKDSKEIDPSRKGLFTSGIVSTREGRRIALFFSGRQHAGENLRDVLLQRDKELPPVIQMSDALSRNLPGELKTIVANCITHGRRRFVDVKDQFPEECRHVLEALRHVYRTDALARRRKLSSEDRLALHQTESGPVMEELHAWLSRQFDDSLVEPNSSLGGAISYMLKPWKTQQQGYSSRGRDERHTLKHRIGTCPILG